ncbi:MAG TPA: tyrosine-type recombinase/integrase [Gemmatimonadales bacterium]
MSDTTKRRGRGEGSVFLPENGRTWWASHYVNGKRERFNTHELTRKLALKALTSRTAAVSEGRALPRADRVTFEDLAAGLVARYQLDGRRSLKRAQQALARLRETFGAHKALSITAAAADAYARDRIASGAKPATVSYELAILKRAIALAVKAGLLNQRLESEPVRLNNARSGFFERADFEAVRAGLPDYLQPVVTFAYLTGWRIGEVLGLTWSRVDFAAGVVRLDVGTTKSGAGRVFPFKVMPELEAVLKAQRDVVSALERERAAVVQNVFVRDGGRILTFRKAWLTAIDKAAHADAADGTRLVVRPQLLGRIVHDFRRSAVRNLVRAGVSEHVAMQLTGHRTRSVFDRYDIVNEADLAAGVTKLAAFHAQPAPKDVLPMRREA